MTSPPPPQPSSGSLPPRPELPAGIDRPPPPPPPGTAPPAWPPWAPFAAMLLTLVIALAGATVIAVVAELGGVDISAGSTPPGVQIGGTIIQDAALVISAVVFARVTAGHVTAREFGLRRVPWRKAVAWVVGVWVAYYVFTTLYALIVNAPETSDQADDLGAGDSTLNLVVVAVLVLVIAPICEELFFRGFLFTSLKRWLGWVPGAIVAGAIFGGIHVGSVDAVFLPALAMFGIGLCVIYQGTGSLLPGMALHALNNALALGVSQDFSVLGTVAAMLASSSAVVTIGLLAARSHRLNAEPAAA